MTPVKENVTQNGEETPQTPVGLKVLVVVLGVAIIFMLGLIIWTVMTGGAAEDTPPPPVATIGETANSAESFDIAVTRPAESELISVQGSPVGIILHFRSLEADTVIIIDRVTGKESRLTSPKK